MLSAKEIRTQTTAAISIAKEVPTKPRDPRLPPPGALLQRQFGYHTYHVHVLKDGFVWGQNTYATVTEVGKAITGASRNGFSFFGLTMPWPQRAATLRGRRLNRFTSINLPAATEF